MGLKPDLFIPHKNTASPVSQPDYGQDMRTIEMWARGVKSGGTAGAVRFTATVGNASHSAIWGGIQNTSITLGTVDSNLPLFAGDTGYSPSVFFSGTVITATIGGGGMYTVPTTAAAYNIIQGMIVNAPNFTGPTSTIGIILYLRVVQVLTAAVSPGNAFKVTSRQINVPSGTSHSFVAGDFLASTITGTDLTFSSATLQSAGGLPYIGGWNLSIVWDTANTLTQA